MTETTELASVLSQITDEYMQEMLYDLDPARGFPGSRLP